MIRTALIFAALTASSMIACAYSAEQEQNAALTVCWARTPCPNGLTIQCTVYANPYLGQACSWSTVPFQSVECRGWDAFGRWLVLFNNCWYTDATAG